MDWATLVDQVSWFWIAAVFLATACLIALTIFFFVTMRGLAALSRRRFSRLDADVDALESCRIENLPAVSELVGQQMNKEFQACFTRLAEDSAQLYEAYWIPDPTNRLPIPEVLTEPVRQAFGKSTGSAVILAGVAVSALAMTSGYVFNGFSFADTELMRFLAMVPVLVAALGMLILHQAGESYFRSIRRAWQHLMVTLERKLPVYTQAAQTAILLNRMKDYDARMAEATTVLAGQVQSLVSGKLTDAVSGAVKYVMSATVAPSISKSTEALAMLAQQLDARMQQTDQAVVRLYTDLEVRQQKQSELWLKRYQEIAEILSDQQDALTKNLTESERLLVDNLSKSQTFALERLVEEQKQSLTHMNSVTQKSWTMLQERLTQIITQLSDNQTNLLTSLNTQQQQTLTQVSVTSEHTAETLRVQYDNILQQMRQTQADLWQQLAARQTEAYDSLLTQQKESFAAVSDQQKQAYLQVAQAQQEGLGQMKTQQVEAIRQMSDSQSAVLKEIDQRQLSALQTISDHQEQSLQTISSQQASALQTIGGQQATALQQLISVQSVTLSGIHKSQEESFNEMARRQQDALRQLADRFAGEVSGTLAEYLAPVTTRLQESAAALVASQAYAKDVREVLQIQSDSAKTLQSSIGDLFAQLIETRKTMSEDLVSLKASSGVMSKSAETMSRVYAGSQSGLSEAISQMSNDLMRLSDVLSAVMAGSAEQTRLMQSQSMETYEINQKHLDAVREQITFLSDELSTRIDQLMIGFTNLTQDLVKNIDVSINSQNDTLGGTLRSLTDVMSEEARSMSLFAQQINIDIDTLNANLKTAVSEFDAGMRTELTGVLGQFDNEVADIVRRLSQAALELGDAVEALPEAIRHAAAVPVLAAPQQNTDN